MRKIILLFLVSISMFLVSFKNAEVDNYYKKEYVVYYDDLVDINPNWTVEEVYEYYDQCTLKNLKSTMAEHINVFNYQLTNDELALISSNLGYLDDIKKCHSLAINDTKKLFPNNSSDGDFGNAFQHAYWTLLMCVNTSPSFALEFTTAHENYDSNPIIHKNMDLLNNKIAYDYYMNNKTITSDNKAQEAALSLYNDAKLTYIMFNYKYLKQVNIIKSTGKRREIYAYGDFYAYTTTSIPYNVPKTIYNYTNFDIVEGPIYMIKK